MHKICSEILGDGRELSSKRWVLKKAGKKCPGWESFFKNNNKKQQGENIRWCPVFLSGVFGKEDIYIQDINLLYSHPDFGLIAILMIIRFCILPAGLSGAGETAQKCSGQRNTNKNPRALGGLRAAREAQMFSDSPKAQAGSTQARITAPATSTFWFSILNLHKKIKIILNKTHGLFFFFKKKRLIGFISTVNFRNILTYKNSKKI